MTTPPPARQPYIAVLLFGSSADADDYEPLHREDVTLLCSTTPDEARSTAGDW